MNRFFRSTKHNHVFFDRKKFNKIISRQQTFEVVEKGYLESSLCNCAYASGDTVYIRFTDDLGKDHLYRYVVGEVVKMPASLCFIVSINDLERLSL